MLDQKKLEEALEKLTKVEFLHPQDIEDYQEKRTFIQNTCHHLGKWAKYGWAITCGMMILGFCNIVPANVATTFAFVAITPLVPLFLLVGIEEDLRKGRAWRDNYVSDKESFLKRLRMTRQNISNPHLAQKISLLEGVLEHPQLPYSYIEELAKHVPNVEEIATISHVHIEDNQEENKKVKHKIVEKIDLNKHP